MQGEMLGRFLLRTSRFACGHCACGREAKKRFCDALATPASAPSRILGVKMVGGIMPYEAFRRGLGMRSGPAL